MKKFEWPLIVALFAVLILLGITEHQLKKHQAANASLATQLEQHDREIERLTACAVRQIKSLVQICEDNKIQLVQDIETSEWSVGLKPLTPTEVEEFREQWSRRLETGISPMSGKLISFDDPFNTPTVALIAGLKAARFIRETLDQTELQKAQDQIRKLEEKLEVSKIAGREIYKLVKALDKFVLEHPEIADDFPKHPFRVEDGDEEEDEKIPAPVLAVMTPAEAAAERRTIPAHSTPSTAAP